MISNFIKYLSILALFFGLQSAFGEELFDYSNQDQSIIYLKWFFGDVGGVLPGGYTPSQQLIGTLMRYLNLGILAFATLIITYTILMGVVKTAQDAAFMGREGKSGWTAIRSALGIGLLVPGASGYSLIQVFVMWVVVQGVGLADTVWEKGSAFVVSNGWPTQPGSSDNEGESPYNIEKLAIQVGPRSSLVPMALSNISSQLCSTYLNEMIQEKTILLKNCLTLEAAADVSGAGESLRISGGTPGACDALFEGLSQTERDAIRNNRGALVQTLSGAVASLPKVALYSGYRAPKDEHQYVFTPDFSKKQDYMPYGIFGIKQSSTEGTKIIPLCGVYPLSTKGEIKEGFDYTGFHQQLFNVFKNFSVTLRPISKRLFDAWAKSGGRMKDFTALNAQLDMSSYDIALKNAVQNAVRTWRSGIKGPLKKMIDAFSADDSAMPSIEADKGWLMAASYYWNLSGTAAQGLEDTTAMFKALSLCRIIENPIAATTTKAIDDRKNVGQNYPVRCDKESIESANTCRILWNDPETGTIPTDPCITETGTANQSNIDDIDGKISQFFPGKGAEIDTLQSLYSLTGLTSWDFFSKSVATALTVTGMDTNLSIESDQDLINSADALGESGDFSSTYNKMIGLTTGISLLMTGLTVMAVFLGAGIGGAITGASSAVIIAGFGAVTDMFRAGNTDPIVALFTLGHAISGVAIGSYFGAALIIYGLTVAQGTMNSMHGLAEGAKLSMSWFMPLFQVLLIAALANGGMLAIYIPFIPFMIYLFAVMGWLITVLEAMVAGPLIAMGVTHPQGHDLLGKSEQAMMMIISVFLRPVLITIGFFASVLMVRVGFHMFKVMFDPYSEYFLVSSINPVMGVIFFVTLTVILIGVIETAFSLINVIPERVMHWIGVQGMAQDLSRSTMQMAQGASKSAGQTVGETMGRTGQDEQKQERSGFVKAGDDPGKGGT